VSGAQRLWSVEPKTLLKTPGTWFETLLGTAEPGTVAPAFSKTLFPWDQIAAIAERKVAGPRIICVGAVLSPTGGHGQIYGFRHDVCACVQSTSGICDGADECRRAVRRQVSYGADAIKFVATGGVLSNIKAGLDQQFTGDEIRSIIETAHRLGRRAAAHAHGAAGINAALEAGVDSIEHGSFLDARSLELFIAKGAFHMPTIIAGVTVLEMAQGDGVLTPAQIEKAMIVGVRSRRPSPARTRLA
jgi:imidazolonepropionase-like amidohydrolase